MLNDSTNKTASNGLKHWVIPDPHFPVSGLNTDIYSKNLCIQFYYRKIRTSKNSFLGHFSQTKILWPLSHSFVVLQSQDEAAFFSKTIRFLSFSSVLKWRKNCFWACFYRTHNRQSRSFSVLLFQVEFRYFIISFWKNIGTFPKLPYNAKFHWIFFC